GAHTFLARRPPHEEVRADAGDVELVAPGHEAVAAIEPRGGGARVAPQAGAAGGARVVEAAFEEAGARARAAELGRDGHPPQAPVARAGFARGRLAIERRHADEARAEERAEVERRGRVVAGVDELCLGLGGAEDRAAERARLRGGDGADVEGQQGAQLRGQRGGYLAAAKMERRGVEGEARRAGARVRRRVDRVAEYGQACGGEVDADLVGAAGD